MFLCFIFASLPVHALAGKNNSEQSNNANLESYLSKKYGGKPNICFLVERPVKNERTVIAKDTKGNWNMVGHTFIRLDYGNGKVYYYGFYPNSKNGLSLDEVINKKNVTGKVKTDDDKHLWNIGISYASSKKNLDAVKDFINKSIDKKVKYNMVTYNCTTFAVEAIKKAGITPPTDMNYWTIPDELLTMAKKSGIKVNKKNFYGYSPADATQDIKKTGLLFFTNGLQGDGGKIIEYAPSKKK